jgi:hypothetical protein
VLERSNQCTTDTDGNGRTTDEGLNRPRQDDDSYELAPITELPPETFQHMDLPAAVKAEAIPERLLFVNWRRDIGVSGHHTAAAGELWRGSRRRLYLSDLRKSIHIASGSGGWSDDSELLMDDWIASTAVSTDAHEEAHDSCRSCLYQDMILELEEYIPRGSELTIYSAVPLEERESRSVHVSRHCPAVTGHDMVTPAATRLFIIRHQIRQGH